jgi:two-component system sensor histidine kinase BaeS
MNLRTRLLVALAGSGVAILIGSLIARDIAIRYASEASIRSSIEGRLASLNRETCETDFELVYGPPGPGGPGGGPGRGGNEDPNRGRLPDGFRPRGFGPGPPGPRPGGPGGPRGFGDPEFRRRPGPPPEGSGRERGDPGPFGGPFGAPRATRVFFYDASFQPKIEDWPPFPEAAKARLLGGETFVNGRDERGFFGALATSWNGGRCSYAIAFLPTPPPLASFPWLIIGSLMLIGAPAIALWIALAKPVARIRALASDVRLAASKQYETSVPTSGRDEIAELGTAFNDAAAVVRAHVAEVERRERALRDFVAHTTHDVALPLSVLLSHVSRLRDVEAASPAPTTVAAIAQETQYIASLLANLEAVSRLESDPVLHERHPVDLVALVERVAVRHRGVASSGGLDFNHSVPETPVWVLGDVTLIEQAANNLVHNAIQYNRAGGHVALVLDLAGNGFRLRVSDDGPGVAEEQVSRLGESRFRSEAARARRPNGMGLGLSIAMDVARRHDFNLSLGNLPEGGFEAVLAGPAVQKPSQNGVGS